MRRIIRTVAIAAILAICSSTTARAADKIAIVATTPDLASIARAVGGDDVAVTSIARGTEDPHFVEARPSFVRDLHGADMLIANGLDLEIGWLPVLVQSARNGKISAGGVGMLDASRAIRPIDVPAGVVDRSMGDVHPRGNPHYLLDPTNGVRVARLVRDKIIALDPAHRAAYADRCDRFVRDLMGHYVGDEAVRKYGVDALLALDVGPAVASFLASHGDGALVGGWIATLRPDFGAKVVADHSIWPYFARAFGIRVIAFLEPKPGIPPTTSHLRAVIERMKSENARAILSAAYYDPRHARFVARATGAAAVEMANQVGARTGADDYIAMLDYNVNALARALGDGGSHGRGSGDAE